LEYIDKTFEYDFIELKGSLVLDTSDLGDEFLPHEFEIKGHSSKTLLSKYESDIALGKASLLFDNIVYFLSGTDDIKKVEKLFVKYWYNQVKFHNKRNDEITEDLQEFISKILDGLELDFTYSYIDEDDNIFFENKSSEKFKISELSTGEQTLLSKVLYLFLKDYKDKVILIDEPELSLHPSWQNKVLKIYDNFAKQNTCQVIIATHSPHIIGSAKNEYLRFLVKENNKIVVKQLSSSPLDRDTTTILKTIMGANYIPKELEELHLKYRELVNSGKVNTQEAEELKKEILKFESPNSSFFQGIAFDLELM
jgi:predicted ATP-binding protein involved in virulence